MKLTMPDPSVLYRLAKQAKDRAKLLRRDVGPDTMAEHLNRIGNKYLVANEGREIK